MDYAECLNYLDDLGHELRGVKFGLEALQCVLASLEHPERRYPTAIVAGTNGKGSTSAMLASILQCAGYRTGLYTSPHLIRVNERIRVNGSEIGEEEFARCFTAVRESVDRLLQEKVLAQRLSFFEFLTATAFLHFAGAPVDFVVLEVGMGGRLDATNVTEPRVALITNVELDHEEFLGNTHTSIAREKAGVIKPGRPVISACDHPEAAEVIRARCAELGSELLEVSGLARVAGPRRRNGRYLFDLALDGNCLSQLVSPLRGQFQVKNAVAAAAAAWRLAREGYPIRREAIVEGLREARWPGRLEVVAERPLVLLDGAHNPAAARAVADFLKEEHAGRRVRLVYASMRDKAIAAISSVLFPLAEEVLVTQPRLARAATPQEILAAAQEHSARIVVEPDPVRALERACQASAAQDVVLAVGSLFLVGELKKALQEGRLSPGAFSEANRTNPR